LKVLAFSITSGKYPAFNKFYSFSGVNNYWLRQRLKYYLKYLLGYNPEAYGLPMFKNLILSYGKAFGFYESSAYILLASITIFPRTAY